MSGKFRWVTVKLQTKMDEVETLWRLNVQKKRDCPADGICVLGPYTDGKYMIREACPHYKQDVEARNRKGRMEVACACPPIHKL